MLSGKPEPAELVRRLQEGDSAAMEELFAREAAGLGRTVRGLCCGDIAVDDVVQEVFVIAFTRVRTFEGRTPVASWLRGIAVNVVRNRRRRQRRRGALDERFGTDVERQPDTPEGEIVGRQLERRLWRAVEGLSDPRREAFVLRILEQRSLEECAAILGVSAQSVSRRALAAVRQVKQELGEGTGS